MENRNTSLIRISEMIISDRIELTTVFLSSISGMYVSHVHSLGKWSNLRHVLGHEPLRTTITLLIFIVQCIFACGDLVRCYGKIMW